MNINVPFYLFILSKRNSPVTPVTVECLTHHSNKWSLLNATLLSIHQQQSKKVFVQITQSTWHKRSFFCPLSASWDISQASSWLVNVLYGSKGFHRSDPTPRQRILTTITAHYQGLKFTQKQALSGSKRVGFVVHKHNNEHDFHTANTLSTCVKTTPSKTLKIFWVVLKINQTETTLLSETQMMQMQGKRLWCDNLASVTNTLAKFSTRKTKNI